MYSAILQDSLDSSRGEQNWKPRMGVMVGRNAIVYAETIFLAGGMFLWVHIDFSTLSLDMFFSAAHLKKSSGKL